MFNHTIVSVTCDNVNITIFDSIASVIGDVACVFEFVVNNVVIADAGDVIIDGVVIVFDVYVIGI